MGISRLPFASITAGILLLTLSACGGEPIVFNGNIAPASSEASTESSADDSSSEAAESSADPESSASTASSSSVSTSSTSPQSSSSLSQSSSVQSSSSSVRSSSIASSSAAATGKELYNSATLGCSLCHGATGDGGTERTPLIPGDWTKNSLVSRITSSGGPMPPKQAPYIGKTCSVECAQKIAEYIVAGFPASAEVPTALFLKQSAASSTPAYSLVNSSEASCGIAYSNNDLRPLTKQEYSAVIFQLTGVNLINTLGQSTYDALPPDNQTLNSTDTQLAYSNVANAIVNNLASSNFSAINCTDLSSEQCYGQLIDQFACKAFKRPLTAAERNNYLATYTANSPAKAGIEKVAKAILTSANFIYRSNIGLSLIERENNSDTGLNLASAASLINGPKTLAIYQQDTLNGNFSGSDLLEISIKSTQSASGLWPVMRVTIGESTFVDVVANHPEATYKFQITGLTGSHSITIANQQAGAPLEYKAGHNLIISSVKLALSY